MQMTIRLNPATETNPPKIVVSKDDGKSRGDETVNWYSRIAASETAAKTV